MAAPAVSPLPVLAGWRGFLERHRGTIEGLTVALIVALFVKEFLAEAYRIPTSSMEPTLIGAESGGDRILVNKLLNSVEGLHRWDVSVFLYPFDRECPECRSTGLGGDLRGTDVCPRNPAHLLRYKHQHYIKRLVGLPGDRLYLENGDVHLADAAGAWRIPQKTHDAQRSLWLPVYQHALTEPPPSEALSFEPLTGLSFSARGLETGAGQVTRITNQRPLNAVYFRADEAKVTCPHCNAVFDTSANMDHSLVHCVACGEWVDLLATPFQYLDDDGGWKAAASPDEIHTRVGDLRLAFCAEPLAKDSRMTLSLEENGSLYQAVIGSGPDSGGKLDLAGQQTTFPSPASPGEEGAWVFENLDNVVRLSYQGIPMARVSTPSEALPPGGKRSQSSSTVSVELSGPWRLRDWDLKRDVYYSVIAPNIISRELGLLGPGPSDWDCSRSALIDIPQDSYLMLGDNSFHSADSRYWGYVPAANLKGKAFSIFWPLARIRRIR